MIRPVALTCGDPAGIGPEIAARAWQTLRGACPFVWIGDPDHLPPGTPVARLTDARDSIAACATALPVLPLGFPAPVVAGRPDARNAHAVISAIETAVALVRAGHASSVCTGPVSKQVLIDGADFPHPGHTEFLAAMAGGAQVVMMLASEQLRVVPATIHIPLAQVAQTLTPGLLRRTIDITARGLRRDFAIAHPRIAICGLNPHAGEGGKIGTEERDWIAPLIADLQARDLTLTGPHSADTLFHAAARDRYDAAIAMYHDQALIPIKTLDFDRGVNVTLGLPFIRTSPDHGTAFDIAGRGLASATSLIEALKLAHLIATRRDHPSSSG